MNTDVRQLEIKARQIRREVIRMLVRAGSGHSAGSLGMAEVMTVLFFGGVMRYDPKRPNWAERDRLVLSAGHICPALYAAMALTGFFSLEKLLSLRQLGSLLQGHPGRELAGIELATGGLGQGLSVGAGMALAAKIDRKQWRVLVVMSDGEQQEGQTWEAVTFAGKYRLDNLVGLIDYNNIQISGRVDEVMPLGNIEARYEAVGWRVATVDGHNVGEIARAMGRVSGNREDQEGKPTVIICRTIPGKGVSFMEGDYRWHGRVPTREEGKRALRELKKD